MSRCSYYRCDHCKVSIESRQWSNHHYGNKCEQTARRNSMRDRGFVKISMRTAKVFEKINATAQFAQIHVHYVEDTFKFDGFVYRSYTYKKAPGTWLWGAYVHRSLAKLYKELREARFKPRQCAEALVHYGTLEELAGVATRMKDLSTKTNVPESMIKRLAKKGEGDSKYQVEMTLGVMADFGV